MIEVLGSEVHPLALGAIVFESALMITFVVILVYSIWKTRGENG